MSANPEEPMRSGVYRRSLPAAGLAIEANTERVPADGRYHLIQGEQILFSSSNLEAVTERYDQLCAEFWRGQLESGRPEERVQAAIALLHRDRTDERARAIVQSEGSELDRRRMQEMDRRAASRSRALAQREAGSRAG